jgi:hypothetical protein
VGFIYQNIMLFDQFFKVANAGGIFYCFHITKIQKKRKVGKKKKRPYVE